ncbi:ciliary microtubule inner protein 2A isoform 2-T2 [Anomaloglossus baeobatrachus]|uniref:ciliary microtubule inner protein 2A isoform X2 n=1 Tax=Anomaloglossus baeobatrachus TaxID=238106 RepID=UPI003F4FD6EE
MAQEQESGAFIPDPYHVPGYTGFCPQLHYQLGNTYGTTTNCLLAKPSITKSPHSILSPPRLRPNDTPEPPKLQPSQVHSCTADRGIVLPKINIPPGYVGRRPKVQFQQASSFTRTVSDTADDFLEVQSSVTRGHVKLPAENTCGHGNAKDVYNAREWKPKAENKAPLSNCKKALKVTLPENLQRKAIPGYTGFIPLYQYALGVGFGPGVKMSMDEFDKYQALGTRSAPLTGTPLDSCTSSTLCKKTSDQEL